MTELIVLYFITLQYLLLCSMNLTKKNIVKISFSLPRRFLFWRILRFISANTKKYINRTPLPPKQSILYYKFQTKNNDFNRNFYNFLLLVPCPNNFLVLCICIPIFHGIYSTQSTQKYCLLCGLKMFSYLAARNWENFKLLGDLLYWGDLISFLGEEASSFSCISHQLQIMQTLHLLKAKMSVSWVYANFSHFYLGIFSLFSVPSNT